MATYFLIENSTIEGSKTVKEAPERSKGVVEFARSLGVEIQEWFWTLGPFDFIMKVEAPDDEAIARFCLAVNKGGNVTIKSMRAFTPDQWAELIDQIP